MYVHDILHRIIQTKIEKHTSSRICDRGVVLNSVCHELLRDANDARFTSNSELCHNLILEFFKQCNNEELKQITFTYTTLSNLILPESHQHLKELNKRIKLSKNNIYSIVKNTFFQCAREYKMSRFWILLEINVPCYMIHNACCVVIPAISYGSGPLRDLCDVYPAVFSLRLMCINVINNNDVDTTDFPEALLDYKHTYEWELLHSD